MHVNKISLCSGYIGYNIWTRNTRDRATRFMYLNAIVIH